MNKLRPILFLLVLVVLNNFRTLAADFTWTSPSVTIANNQGCLATTYTFTQTTANNNNSRIDTTDVVTITFPAGVNVSTATKAGSSFKGFPIMTGWTISGQTISFKVPIAAVGANPPIAVGKAKTVTIIIANVTNGNNITGNCTVECTNTSAGVNTANTYAITNTVCPVVPTNDNCGGAVSLTPPAAGSSTCTTTNGTTFGATTSPQTACAGAAQSDDDVWYSFVANNSFHQVTVDGVAGFNAIIELFSGSCTGTMTSMNCINASGDGGVETANLTGLTSGNTYFVRVSHSLTGPGVSAANSFTICVTSTPPAAGCSGIGTGNLTAASLPYSSGAQTTCGAADNITSSNVTAICGSSLYYGGEDKVVQFTPATSGNVSINLTSSGSWVGMMLYQGCPVTSGVCVASAQSSAGNQSIGCATVTAGQTYYLVVDSWPSPTCNPFSVTISAPTGGIPPGTTCSNPVVATLPYIANNESTLCFGDDYTNSTAGVGSTLYMSGEDKVYAITTTGPECISISITNANTSYVGYHVFQGCPGSGGVLLGRGEYATGGALSGSVTLPAAGTYYIIVDTYASPSSVNYNINIQSLGSGPVNDNVCTAQPLTLGVAAGGDNNCSGSSGEPATPTCWSTGTMNTVWYTVTVPASGKVRIRTTAGSLLNTQIAVYTGTDCNTLTFNSCNDNVASCAGFYSNDSELNLTGLTVGATLYIRVDGTGNTTGTFSILAIDGNNSITPIPGQDCGDPNPVCQQVVSVSNPGYSGFGNICDLPTSYCLASGERNIVWYRVPISVAGTFGFDIVPNDFVSSTESETDYDFAIWEITDAGTVIANCTQIANGSVPPDACNYSYLGVTGLGTGGNPPTSLNTTVCPTCPGGYNPSTTYAGAYEASIAADAGDVFLIAVSNFTSSTAGFRMRFNGTATIDFAASLSAAGGVTWSGGDLTTPSEWTDVDNWGGCVAPDCNRDAFVAPFNNQPILLSNITYSVKNLTIQAGATLTLQANATLVVCGDFYNYGSLVADPTSRVIFKGSASTGQNVAGNLTGSNKFGTFIVYKAAGTGTVNALNDIEIGGNFSTANINSIFNTNGRYITLGGNFGNFSGDNTYSGIGSTGTLEFNGSGAQVYSQGASQSNLNFVVVNNTAAAGSGVNLTGNIASISTSLGTIAAQSGTDMFIKPTSGSLTLTLGTITTGGSSGTSITGNRVHVLNTTPACVTVGSTLSYVDGNLRRYLTTSGDYNFPLGHASSGKGYQRARTVFSSASMTYLDTRFDPWPTATPYTQGASDCSVTWDQVSENNGYWTMIPNSGTGNYDMTLYPLNATNTTGMSAWTIIKRPHSTAIDNSGWILDGICAASTATQVTRTGMSGFSFFAVDQALTPLPVELIIFDGINEGLRNKLYWQTASERENDYFTLERSPNGYDFTFLAEIDGAGTSNSILNYHSYDYNPFPGITYYRLKQTNFNGEFTYSNVVALTNEMNKIEVSEIYPNPTNSSSTVDIFSPYSDIVSIKMYDQAGRLISEIEQHISVGVNSINLSMNELARGVYTIDVTLNDSSINAKRRVVKN